MTEKTGKYGLPLNVQFCKKCTMNNQRPSSTVEFKQTVDEKKRTLSFDLKMTLRSNFEVNFEKCF